MITLTSTAGLHAQTSTVAAAAAALSQHLREVAGDRLVHFHLTTEHGTVHSGHLNLNGLADDRGFIGDTVHDIASNLRQDIDEHQATAARPVAGR